MAPDFAPLRRTLDFLLYDWLRVDALPPRSAEAAHDRATLDAVLDMCQRMAAERFAPFNREVDVHEPRIEDGRVVLPAATAEACAAYAASGMLAAGQGADMGGMELPCTVEMAANSFFSAASIGLKAYSLLTVANANLLMVHGTERQREVFARPQFEGRWFGTMNLSEPQAGSSLSDVMTRAVPDGPGSVKDPLGPRFRLSGRKMWISGGDHELGENIVHLVLAKEPLDDGRLPAGTQGLSLFIVPRQLVDADGRLTGVRNDVALAGLNHKLGYRGTVNALLNYGEEGGAIGWRVGDRGEGLRCMFHMMNEARIQVGFGAAMLGWAAQAEALEYARQRPQGRPILPGARAAKDASHAPVPIIEHADVRRMLVAQKAYAEGAIALCLRCARWVDEARGSAPEEAALAAELLEVLTPVVKSWPSEWCLEGNSLAIQVLGGYGYTRDFSVEQHWRDNRLNMIHEGTHGIQGLDLLGRKVRMHGGRGMKRVEELIHDTVQHARRRPALAALGEPLAQAMHHVRTAADCAWANDDAREATQHATAFLRAFGHLVMGWVWLDVALAADAAGDTLRSPHSGLILAARYFLVHELPLVGAWLTPILQQDRVWLEMSAEVL